MTTNPSPKGSTSRLQDEVDRLVQEFTVSRARLREICDHFGRELAEGLQKNGANIAMNITWSIGWPTGEERGSFLTLDLGGTNLRVCWITLSGRHEEIALLQERYKLPAEVKTGSAEDLWDFCANALQKFVEKHQLEASHEEPLRLGFTFSYPAFQERIDHGVLVTWTKGFEIDGVEGEDVAQHLRDAIEKRSLPIRLVAVINDTTGAMIASAYKDPETIIGAIFGTGCNAAYIEDVQSIPKLDSCLPPETAVAINCEYGAFDNARRVLPITKFDKIIDDESPKPGEQAFEKMSAGLYLGEIFRLAVLDLHHQGLVFNGQDSTELDKAYVLDTGFLSAIEEETQDNVKKSFKETLDLDLSDEEYDACHRLGEVIALRAARLCTTGVVAICEKKGIKSGHVAADGSVANKHPKFKARWAEAMAELLDWPEDRKEDPITITPAIDGSGIGAAVIAAMSLSREGRALP